LYYAPLDAAAALRAREAQLFASIGRPVPPPPPPPPPPLYQPPDLPLSVGVIGTRPPGTSAAYTAAYTNAFAAAMEDAYKRGLDAWRWQEAQAAGEVAAYERACELAASAGIAPPLPPPPSLKRPSVEVLAAAAPGLAEGNPMIADAVRKKAVAASNAASYSHFASLPIPRVRLI
jgi:hypothetical protein